MRVYEIIIHPLTGFGTPLKGDTIFGHLCWQIAYDESVLKRTLSDLLGVYSEKPFAVLSSAYPCFLHDGRRFYAMRTPALPTDHIFNLPPEKRERIKKRKDLKKKVWTVFERGKPTPSFKGMEYLDDVELAAKTGGSGQSIGCPQTRNKIDRLTGRTGEGFAPFVVDRQIYHPGTELALFVGIDSDVADIGGIRTCLERIGEIGFGKDASTGLGRFRVTDCSEIVLAEMGSKGANACYNLSPCVPEKDTYSAIYSNPFTRFGRHGDVLAKSKNPFKNPIIMADEGAVMIPKDTEKTWKLPYIGAAAAGLSKADEKTVAQGYSLYIPVSMEVTDG